MRLHFYQVKVGLSQIGNAVQMRQSMGAIATRTQTTLFIPAVVQAFFFYLNIFVRNTPYMPDSNEVSKYPAVKDPALVGTYSGVAKAGGGLVWDEVLEYRVWFHPENGAPDIEEGNDYYYTFETYEEGLVCSQESLGAEEPLALILQEEYIDEPEPGKYIHVMAPRWAEWPVEFLSRPRRNTHTIPDFLSPNAPANRLAILRGQA